MSYERWEWKEAVDEMVVRRALDSIAKNTSRGGKSFAREVASGTQFMNSVVSLLGLFCITIISILKREVICFVRWLFFSSLSRFTFFLSKIVECVHHKLSSSSSPLTAYPCKHELFGISFPAGTPLMRGTEICSSHLKHSIKQSNTKNRSWQHKWFGMFFKRSLLSCHLVSSSFILLLVFFTSTSFTSEEKTVGRIPTDFLLMFQHFSSFSFCPVALFQYKSKNYKLSLPFSSSSPSLVLFHIRNTLCNKVCGS